MRYVKQKNPPRVFLPLTRGASPHLPEVIYPPLTFPIYIPIPSPSLYNSSSPHLPYIIPPPPSIILCVLCVCVSCELLAAWVVVCDPAALLVGCGDFATLPHPSRYYLHPSRHQCGTWVEIWREVCSCFSSSWSGSWNCSPSFGLRRQDLSCHQGRFPWHGHQHRCLPPAWRRLPHDLCSFSVRGVFIYLRIACLHVSMTYSSVAEGEIRSSMLSFSH